MLVELGDVVQLPGDLANLQLGVDVVVPLGERGLVWVVETRAAIQGGGHKDATDKPWFNLFIFFPLICISLVRPSRYYGLCFAINIKSFIQ